QRLQLAATPRRRLAPLFALAVKGADDIAAAVEDGGGDDGLQCLEAGSLDGGGLLRVLPERAFLLAQGGPDVLARLPGEVRGIGAVGGGDGPGVALQQQDPAGIETDDQDQGLGGAVEEVGGGDGALQDAHGSLQPADQLIELRNGQRRQRLEVLRQGAEGG